MMKKLNTIDPNLRKTLIGFAAVIGCIFIFAWMAFGQPLDANHQELGWKSMETENFVIHYHDGSQRTALVIAKIAEEVHPKVTEVYGYAPDTKFHFIVKDTDDYANGAAYYYNNKMLIWCTALDYELRGTHNWLRDVITHEYTHIIQLGAARKASRKMPAIYLQYLGYEDEKRKDVLYGYPNILASYPLAMTIIPMWFAEGTAQYNNRDLEYDFWDSHRDMQFRTRLLEGDLLPFNDMEIFGKTSLGNESVYNHGFGLVRYIAKEFGDEALKNITKESAKLGRWDFNAAIERAVGVPAEAIYENWKASLAEEYLADTETIRANIKTGTIVESEGYANLYPRWSPDGENLYYVSNQGHDYFSERSLYSKSVDSDEEAEVLIKDCIGSFDISDDGRWIVYSKLVRQANESYYSDIFLFDTKKKKSHRVTKFARVSEPSFSQDERSLVFVVNHDGTKDLATVNLPMRDQWKKIKKIGPDQITRLTDFNDGRRVYRPMYSKDGKSILFSISGSFGRDIMLIDPDGSNMRPVLEGKGDQRDPFWSEDGRSIYYSADNTGIFNLYRVNTDGTSIEGLTNVTSGAFQPALKNGKIVYSEWSLDG
jgi:Tol biopolymer transport system component